jgi:hypothetical protein
MLFCVLARASQCTLVGDLRLCRSEFEMFKWDGRFSDDLRTRIFGHVSYDN